MTAARQDNYRLCARALYETPVAFWMRLLGEGLHFNLGHFPSAATGLAESMRIAVSDLASLVPKTRIRRVVDVGCGWGGPAFQLAKLWGCEVVGLTVSRRQAAYTNRAARKNGPSLSARAVDIESPEASIPGLFDVVWMDEALEHISDRRAVLGALHGCTTAKGILAMD